MLEFLSLKGKIPWIFIIVALLFCSTNIVIEMINERFWLNDFQVYYSASANFVSGENPYGEAFGLSSGFFKYSPFTLLIFSPYTLFSFENSKIIHFVLISLATLMSILSIYGLLKNHALKDKAIKPRTFMFVLLLIAVVHLSREFHLGNINMILILLFLFSIHCVIKEKRIPAAITLSLIFLLKP